MAVLLASALGYMAGLRRARGFAAPLDSLPGYHGTLVALWCALPALGLGLLWLLLEGWIIEARALRQLGPDSPAEQALARAAIAAASIGDADPALAAVARERAASRLLMNILCLACAALCGWLCLWRLAPGLRARRTVERVLRAALALCAMVAVFITLGIVMSLLFEALRFFALVSPFDFLFGLHWSPQTAIREDQVGSSGSFGAVPLFVGTLQIAVLAMLVAAPVGLMSAIYLSEYASGAMRARIKPMLEILAGVPTVVYGFFAALALGPWVRDAATALGLDAASESALAAGLVMGVMIIPFVSSLSDDVINAVPQAMRDGSYGLGATRSETIKRVLIPAALPGVIGSLLLALSRAIGETMIVVMAAGLAANLTANPLESVTTVTVQIVTLLVGDQEFDSAKTLAAFALGLMLFAVTLCLNIIALMIVKRFREQYE